MNKWAQIDRDEQETHVNIDYHEKMIRVYTTREGVAKRLVRAGIEPVGISKIGGEIVGASFELSFFDEKTRYIFSKSRLIGAFQKD